MVNDCSFTVFDRLEPTRFISISEYHNTILYLSVRFYMLHYISNAVPLVVLNLVVGLRCQTKFFSSAFVRTMIVQYYSLSSSLSLSFVYQSSISTIAVVQL